MVDIEETEELKNIFLVFDVVSVFENRWCDAFRDQLSVFADFVHDVAQEGFFLVDDHGVIVEAFADIVAVVFQLFLAVLDATRQVGDAVGMKLALHVRPVGLELVAQDIVKFQFFVIIGVVEADVGLLEEFEEFGESFFEIGIGVEVVFEDFGKQCEFFFQALEIGFEKRLVGKQCHIFFR